MTHIQEQLITRHLNMVYDIISNKLGIRQGTFLYETLVCMGQDELIRAAMAYDPAKAQFSTYAYRCIYGKLLNHLNRRPHYISCDKEDFCDKTPLRIDSSHTDADWRIIDRLLQSGCLTETEETIIRCSYGIDCEPVRTPDLAARLGMTQQNVTRIRRKAIEKLQVYSFFG